MRITRILLLLFISASTMGQQLLLSPDEYVSGNSGNVRILGNVGNKTVCFLESSDAYELLWYDSAMRKVAVSDLDFLEGGGEQFRFYPTDEAVFIFYQKKKRQQVNLFAAKVVPVHKDTIVPVLIDSLSLENWTKSRFKFYNTKRNDRYVYAVSEYYNRNDRLSLQVKVLDKELSIVQQANEQMNDVVYHDLLDVVLDKNDGIHALYGEPAKRGNNIENVLIGSQRANVRTMKFSKLDMKGYSLGGGNLLEHKKNGKLYLGGVLHQGNNIRLAALGAFVYDPIGQQWVASNITDIYGPNGIQKSGLTDMRFKDFLLKDDGGYSIITEKTFKEIYQRNRNIGFVSPGLGMSNISYEVYHTDEIVVFDISATGGLQWFETLLKEQETTDANERYHSFGLLASGMGSVFLFNDQSNKNNRFINAFLSNTGRLQLKQFTADGANVLGESGMLLRIAKQISTNEIVFPIVKRGTLSFAKITF